MFTVTVDIDAAARGITAYASATVEWSVNGVPVVRTYDVASAISISGIAEGVKVIVTDASASPMGGALPAPMTLGSTYSASILIAANKRTTPAVPVIKTALVTLAAAGTPSPAVPVPRGASSVAVYVSGAAPAVAEQTFDGTTVLLTRVNNLFIPLISGANQIVLTIPTGGVGAGKQAAVAFGVDG